MNIAKSWSLLIGIATLGAAPIQSTAAEQPAQAEAAPAPTPAPVPVPVVQALAPRPAAPALDAAPLDPGAFVWRPELAIAGPVEIVVSIPRQLAYVYRGGTLIGVSTVSTGRPGHRTPTGRFPILEKHREHYSNLYSNAPMPFMQRLTMGGIALHAGHIPGRPASHGCVRLPLAFARNLFGVTEVGADVHIIDTAATAATALRMARGEPRIQVAAGSVVLASN